MVSKISLLRYSSAHPHLTPTKPRLPLYLIEVARRLKNMSSRTLSVNSHR